LAAAWLTFALVAMPLALRGDESPQERIARIEALSAEQKAELAQKKKRFDELAADEQVRIRKLQAEIEVRPDKEQLVSVMQNYHDWLKTLSANQRTVLRSKPEYQRVAYIKQLVADQQKAAWRKLAEQASPEDLETVYNWLTEFVNRHREQLAQGEIGKRLALLEEDRQTLILIHLMYANRFPGALRPGRVDVEALIPTLSDAAQEFYNKTSDLPRKIQLIGIWSRAAWWSKAFPNVTSEKLATFYEKLPAEERDKLDMMQAADRDAELRNWYARANFLRRGELGWGGGRGEGRGPRRGGQRGAEPPERKEPRDKDREGD
jgi:hypothetical protein